MKGKKAEEAKGCRGDETPDLGSVDRVEIKILNRGAEKRFPAEGLIQLSFQVAGVESGEVDKVEVETRLGAGGDDQKRNQGQGEGAVPKQTGDDQDQKEVKTMEEFLVVGVLHLPHPPQLLHPSLNFEFAFCHNPKTGGTSPLGQPCGFSAQPFWESLF